MPRFKVTDQNGKSYIVTAPTADDAHTVITNMVNNSTLPMPGSQPPPGSLPVNYVPPNRSFGFTSDDTANPLPAIAAFADKAAGAIPILGPHLQQWRDQANAAVYGMTPEQSREGMNKDIQANPIAATMGEATGSVAPYALAGEFALPARVLGMEGPLLQRLGMTFGSQYAINAGNNMAHGQDLPTAATNAVTDAALSTPFAAFGRNPAAAGPRQDAVQYLRTQGIDLTAGQARNSKGMMYAESQLGGTAAQNFSDRQLSQYTRAALRSAGINADLATPQVMGDAYNRIGGQFDRLAQMTRIRGDQQLQNAILQTAVDYENLTGARNPFLEQMTEKVGNIINTNGGSIPGASYQSLRTDLSSAIDRAKNNPQLGTLVQSLRDMQDALNDAVERSTSGQTREAWQRLRQQYANLMTVTDAVVKTGADAKIGIITPTALDTAVRGSMSKRQYARGYGDLNELARAGVVAMPKMPDSGTASRVAPYLLGGTLGGAGSAAMNSGSVAPIAAALGGMALPPIVGRAMLSGPGRALLENGTNIPASVARGLVPGIVAPLLGR